MRTLPRHLGCAAAAAALTLCTLPAGAQAILPEDSGFYVGGAAGYSSDSGSYSIAGGTLQSQDLHGVGGKVFVGFRFFRYLGAELGYAKLAPTQFELIDANGARQTIEFSHDAVPLSLAGFLPLGKRFEINARFGLMVNSSYNTEQSCARRTTWGYVVVQNCPSTPVTWGLGVRYAFARRWGLRLDYDNYVLRDTASGPRSDLDFFSLGVDYRF